MVLNFKAVYNGMTVRMGYDFAITSFLQKTSKTTPLNKQGQERHSGRTAHLVCNAFRIGMRLLQGLSGLYISVWMVLYGSHDFDRIMRYIGLMRTACLKWCCIIQWREIKVWKSTITALELSENPHPKKWKNTSTSIWNEKPQKRRKRHSRRAIPLQTQQ